jgi:hypothetical protein
LSAALRNQITLAVSVTAASNGNAEDHQRNGASCVLPAMGVRHAVC